MVHIDQVYNFCQGNSFVCYGAKKCGVCVYRDILIGKCLISVNISMNKTENLRQCSFT